MIKKIIDDIKKYGLRTFVEVVKYRKKKNRLYVLHTKIKRGTINSTELNEYYKLKEEVVRMAKRFVLKDGKILLGDEKGSERRLQEDARKLVKDKPKKRKISQEDSNINEFTMEESKIEAQTRFIGQEQQNQDINQGLNQGLNQELNQELDEKEEEQFLNKLIKEKGDQMNPNMEPSMNPNMRQNVNQPTLSEQVNNDTPQYPEQYPDQYPEQHPEPYQDQYPDQYPEQYPEQYSDQYQEIPQQPNRGSQEGFMAQQGNNPYQEPNMPRMSSNMAPQMEPQMEPNQQIPSNLLKVFVAVEDLPELEMLIKESDVEAFINAINEAMATGKPFLFGPFTINGHKIIMYRFERLEQQAGVKK